MRDALDSLKGVSDEALIARVKECASCERQATAQLLAALAELDRRRLYLGLGFSSLFSYCTAHLHMSERAAYSRIEVARLSRRFPSVFAMIADGRVSLTAMTLLAPHLTAGNHRALLAQATHRTAREVERMVAVFRPQASRASVVRRVPATMPVVVDEARTPSSLLWSTPESGIAVDRSVSSTASSNPARVHSAQVSAPVGQSAPDQAPSPGQAAPPGQSRQPCWPPRWPRSPGEPPPPAAGQSPPPDVRYRVSVTISKQAHAELMCARDLLRHAVPSGDIGLVLERAISLLLRDLEKRKLAWVARPRDGGSPAGERRAGEERADKRRAGEMSPGEMSAGEERKGARLDTRHIPASVCREVWRRDRARCAFVGPAGRCRERGFLELHHVVPFAAGGLATAANIELRCRAHNAHEAQIHFGEVRAP